MNNAAQQLSDALADAVSRAEHSVVRVETGRRRPASGVIWSADGLVVTAAHMLEREGDCELQLASGQTQKASWVGVDAASDLAVLRAEGGEWQPLQTAPSESLRRGQLVLSLSRPGRSVRSNLGVLSGLSDEWRAPSGAKIERYVQPDVATEAGFSGGALIDVAGRLIGINTLGVLRATPITLPVPTVQRVVAAVLAHGHIQRGYLGVSSVPARLAQADSERLGQGWGLVLTALEPRGPAAQAGLLLGDVLLQLDGERVQSIGDLQAALEDRAGRSVPLRMLRAGTEIELSVSTSERS